MNISYNIKIIVKSIIFIQFTVNDINIVYRKYCQLKFDNKNFQNILIHV